MSLLFLVVRACNKKLLIVQPQNWATLSYLVGDMTFLCCQGECKQVGNSLFSATVLPVASVADRGLMMQYAQLLGKQLKLQQC